MRKWLSRLFSEPREIPPDHRVLGYLFTRDVRCRTPAGFYITLTLGGNVLPSVDTPGPSYAPEPELMRVIDAWREEIAAPVLRDTVLQWGLINPLYYPGFVWARRFIHRRHPTKPGNSLELDLTRARTHDALADAGRGWSRHGLKIRPSCPYLRDETERGDVFASAALLRPSEIERILGAIRRGEPSIATREDVAVVIAKLRYDGMSVTAGRGRITVASRTDIHVDANVERFHVT